MLKIKTNLTFLKTCSYTIFDGSSFELFALFCVGRVNLRRLRTTQMRGVTMFKKVNLSQNRNEL